MKLASKILSLLILVAFAAFYMSCDGGGGDDQSTKQKQFNKLVGTWNVTTAEDAVSGSRDDFAGVSLTLSGTFSESEDATFQFSMSGNRPDPSPWPKTGTWAFGGNPVTNLVRDPGSQDNEIDMLYEVSDTQLEIEFDVPEGGGWQGGSRGKSVVGHWRFTFQKAQ